MYLNIIQILLLLTIIMLISKKNKQPVTKNKQNVVLDTSVIIDGRILELAKTNFLPGKLIIPKFIVSELQLIADSNDSHKRERARYGLDVIKLLQEELSSHVILSSKDYPNIKTTDDKLVAFASDQNCYLCTNDYNLNKVALVEGVNVLNINELAQSLRPNALPGERHNIKILQKGSNRDQGVGYLDDGTMVVVSGAGNSVGKKVEVNVTRMFQTEAGKMIFANKVNANKK